jgi:hypothetical protein
VRGQFEVAVETSEGYFVVVYPDTDIGITHPTHKRDAKLAERICLSQAGADLQSTAGLHEIFA